MNYCEQYCYTIKCMCNSVKPLLPPEYQQVEYLESSGTQYINTGVNTANDLTVNVKAMNIESPQGNTQNRALIGARTSASNRFFLWVFDGLGYIGYGYGDTYARIERSWSINTVYEITVTISASILSIVRHGDYGWTWSKSITPYSGDIPLYMFATNDNNSSIINELKGRVYYCNIYKNGTLTRDFVPCYRKSDNKPGMYDIVTNTFFTNAGTGEFTVGQDV